MITIEPRSIRRAGATTKATVDVLVDGVRKFTDRVTVDSAISREKFARKAAEVIEGKESDAMVQDAVAAKIDDLLQQILDLPTTADEDAGSVSENSGKRSVLISNDEHRVADEVIDALRKDPAIFHRGGELVRVVRNLRQQDGIIRPECAPTITAAPLAYVRERITLHCNLAKTTNEGERKPAHPPQWLTPAVASRGDWPRLRALTAISDAPVLRADGSIHQKPGFDHRTGVLFETDSQFPPVSSEAKQPDAAAAAKRLFAVVQDFRFEKDDIHKAAWLSSVLTPLARFAFEGPSPLFLADANTRGAGKSFLVQTCGHIAVGRPIPVCGYAHDPAEFSKKITSIARAGDSMVMLDNISGPFGNEALDRALTSTRWRDRLLNHNDMLDLPLLTTWYATGNNTQVAADTSRRIIHIRLDVLEEKPEERSDFVNPNLFGWIKANRPRILTDALTILSAFILNGSPDQSLTPFGSFEGWSALVRSAVVWSGCADPCLTREGLNDAGDMNTEILRRLHDAWALYDPHGTGVIVSELIARLYPAETRYAPMTEECVVMRAAIELMTNSSPGKPPSSRAVSGRLKSFRRRISTDKTYLDMDNSRNHKAGATWMRFQAKNEDQGDSGDSRDSISNSK